MVRQAPASAAASGEETSSIHRAGGASYSTGFHPMLIPRRSRPPLSTSTSAACVATKAVWRCGRLQDPRHQLESSIDGGKIGHQGQGFMDIASVGIGRHGHLGMASGVSAEHMVQDTDIGIPQILRRLGEVADGGEIDADLGGGEGNSDLHGQPSF
jgi:hypothetical protein